MFGFFGLSVLVIPLFLAVLSIYLCLCCRRGKRSSEREGRWESTHPSSGAGGGDHPYGSNTLFAPPPPLPPTTEYDWGQKEETYRSQLPPPYDSPPSYPSLPADPPRPIQGFSATLLSSPPVYTISTSNPSLPPEDRQPHCPIPRQSTSLIPPYPPPPYSAVGQQKY